MDEIRMAIKEDVDAFKTILNSIELFPVEMLDNMMFDYFNNPDSQAMWFAGISENTPVAFGFCAPEELTEGTMNLYAVGIRSDVQDKGIGKSMMRYIEDQLKSAGHRILLVETSGSDEFETTRSFYENLGFIKEAVIRDYWEDGDDKVIFWKKLK